MLKIRTLAAIGSLLLPTGTLLAAEPAEGALSPAKPNLSYVSGPFANSNASDLTGDGSTLRCGQPRALFDCDTYMLGVDLPTDFAAKNPASTITIKVAWPDAAEDYDIYVLNAAGEITAMSVTTTNPEVIVLPAGSGARNLRVRIVPFDVAGGSTTSTIALENFTSAGTPTPAPTPTPTPTPAPVPTPAPAADANAPRFVTYSNVLLASSVAEPTIGYNTETKRGMFLGGSGPTTRITFPDYLVPGQPQACDALWEDVTFLYTDGGTIPTLDPILMTDFTTNRTFVSQLAGAGSRLAYTDDDGESWTPGQLATPFSGGADHQTVGSGPYPAGSPFKTPLSDIAVYYCGQTQAGFCQRSDNGGLSFGPGVIAHDPLIDNCGNFHGHIKVDFDGIVYLPNAGCGPTQALAVSEDAGTSYVIRPVTPSTEVAGAFDPSVGIASDNTLYFCRTDKDGHVRVAVSKDRGVTWGNDFDIGIAQGVVNGAFPQAVAGDPDRAACAFLGTDTAGNYEAGDFPGVWYAYLAMTYDGGKSWTTVNVSPNDPAQREGGICISGTGCTGNNRNLLDFNEITADEKGRPLFAWADGCTGACVNGLGPNNFGAEGRITRQSGGKSLYKAFDAELSRTVPDGACLAGQRDSSGSMLSWRAPGDNGGDAVTGYRIFRGTSAGSETLLATSGPKLTYDDRTADPAVPEYFYRIVGINSRGDGLNSNTVKLDLSVIAENLCKLPGLTVVQDPAGDESAVQPSLDIRSISVAEPQAYGDRLVITLKVASLATLPPNQLYAVRLKTAKPPANGAEDYFVGMSTSGGMADFVYGTTTVPSAPGAGATVRTFNPAGTLTETGEFASSFKPDGTILLVVPLELIGSPARGSGISGITGSIRATTAGTTAPTAGSATETTGDGSYVLRSVSACIPNTLPIALMSTSNRKGAAPLTVSFDASGSTDSDADDRIASYTLDYGDGTAPVTQATPTFSHSYTKAGVFPARLTVKDTRGAVSSNIDEKVVEISQTGAGTPTPAPTPTPPVGPAPQNPVTGGSVAPDTGRFGGGSFGLALLLPLLAGLGWSRRRRLH